MILITGGTRFIGSSVIRHILGETEESVVNVDKLTYAGNLKSLPRAAGNDRYEFEQVDICDVDELNGFLSSTNPSWSCTLLSKARWIAL